MSAAARWILLPAMPLHGILGWQPMLKRAQQRLRLPHTWRPSTALAGPTHLRRPWL